MEDDKLATWLEDQYDQGHTDAESGLAEHLKVLDTLSIPEINADSLFDKIKTQVEVNKETKPKIYPLYRWAASIAAIFTFCVGGYFLISNNETRIAPTSSIVEHVLPDKSKVTIKGNSELIYDNDFETRSMRLEGEAFFEVEKGSSFMVNTSSGTVEVLGTSFNVFAREDYLMVACKTGKVSVSQNKEETILSPGQMVIINKGKTDTSSVEIDKVDNWVSGESSFQRTPIAIVILSLKEQFNLSIDTNSVDLNDLMYTGSYLNGDIDKALKMVFTPMGIGYKFVNEKKITLFK